MSYGTLTVMQEVHDVLISSISTAIPFEVIQSKFSGTYQMSFLHKGMAFKVLEQ